MYKVEIVENGVQATDTISMLESQGFHKENIYIFAHDKDRSEHLSDAIDIGDIGLKEQGLINSVGNVFKKRGDELRSKLESVGLTKTEAEQYERVLDEGKLVIVGTDEVK